MTEDPFQVSIQPEDVAELAWVAWWQVPGRENPETRFVGPKGVLRMGRGRDCEIRIGAHPIVNARVPRLWAELSWHRGHVMVENVDDWWGLELVSNESVGAIPEVARPNVMNTAPTPAFKVVGVVPGDAERDEEPARFEIHLRSTRSPVRPSIATPGEADPIRTEPGDLILNEAQRAIGKAILALAPGHARRASYEMIARQSNYSMRRVRESVAEMDAMFVSSGLTVPKDGDALDRVTYVLVRHNLLVLPRSRVRRRRRRRKTA